MSTELENQEDPQGDWASKASNMVVGYVDTVRAKTTGPALVASRYAVYMVAAALIGIIVLIIGFILLLRLLIAATSELSFIDDGEPWLAYLIVGGLLVAIGGLLWKLKEPKDQ
jgi:hypothetical protein